MGDRATTQQDSDLERIDLVVLGFAPVDGFHVQGVAEDESDPLSGTQIGKPVPGEDALDGDHKILAIGLDGAEETRRVATCVLVQENIAGLVHDAQVHRPRVQIDPTVMLVLAGVESHRFPSCEWLGLPTPAYPTSGRHRRGP